MDNQQVRIKRHNIYPVFIAESGDVYNLKGLKLKPFVHRSGYLRINVMLNRISYSFSIHREVAKLFLDPPNEDLVEKCSKEHWGKVFVMHKDDNKFNNHYTNLIWGSSLENTRSAFERGLVNSAKGENNGTAKLTNALVDEICQFYENGGNRKEAEVRFGISRHQAYSIHTRRNWNSISIKYKF